MSMHDPDRVEEMRKDIDERSAQGGSKSPDDLMKEAREKHAAAQGDVDNPEDGGSPWDHFVNPHAVKMTVEAEQTGEPLFCFRARDFFSIQVLVHYANIIEQFGPDNAMFIHSVVDSIGEFKEWQKENMDKVRYPD